MIDFDFQVKLFTDQLVELLDDAKAAAAADFASERANWEQLERQYKSEIAGLESTVDNLSLKIQEAELKFETLRSKISGLV